MCTKEYELYNYRGYLEDETDCSAENCGGQNGANCNARNHTGDMADYGKLLTELRRVKTICKNLEKIIAYSRDSIFATDGSGNIVKVNHAYEILSGVQEKELLGKNMRDLEGTLISQSSTLMVLQSKETVTIEQTLYRTKRTSHVTTTPIFDDKGNITMTISNNRDLNEIEQLKTKLASTENLANRYRLQIEAIKAQIFNNKHIVAADKNMLDVIYKANKIAKVDATVLIQGETGTGKELLVEYIYKNSSRSDEAFIKINCGAFPENLIESELFGYEKGSFTGANANGKIGFFEAANNGTLFLDEVGELPLGLQVKLLRVLQEGEFNRIGGVVPVKTNVRIISATNRDLKEMVEMKLFRADLYYRLNVVSITIPPLRERKDDIIPLSVKFLEDFNKKYRCNKSLSPQAYQILRHYDWPGNVRELHNVLEQSVIISETDKIMPFNLPISGAINLSDFETVNLEEDVILDDILARIEHTYITQAYEIHKSVRKAAKSLGMKTTRYVTKKKKYDGDVRK